MKPRFVNQPRQYDCGPIVLLNALKWSGVPATLKSHYRRLYLLCKTRGLNGPLYSGTKLTDFKKAIQLTGLRSSYNEQPTMEFLENEISSGRAVILNHKTPGGGHFTLVTKSFNNGEYFEVVNISRDHRVAFVRRDLMRRWLHYKTRPLAWSIRKKETA